MRESLTKLNGCAQLYLQTEEHRAFAARRGIAAPCRSPPPRSPPRTGGGAPRATPHAAAAAPLALTPPAAARLAKQRPQGGGTELHAMLSDSKFFHCSEERLPKDPGKR